MIDESNLMEQFAAAYQQDFTTKQETAAKSTNST